MNTPESERQVLLQHCARSGTLHRLVALQHYLINEMVTKKARRQSKSGQITWCDETSKFFFQQTLMMGRKEMQAHSAYFPWFFKMKLEDALYKKTSADTEPHLDRKHVYYSRAFQPGPLCDAYNRAVAFDSQDWQLSNSTKLLTLADIDVLRRFRHTLLDFMDECIAVVAEAEEETEKLAKTRNRYEQVSEEE